MRTFEDLTLRGQVARLRVLARRALAEWGVEAESLDLLQHGENTTFRVLATGDLYVLRIHRPPLRTAAVVSSEMQWLRALRASGTVLAPDPVPTPDGRLVVVAGAAGVPEPRLCVLLRWVEGRFHDASLTPADLRVVGVLAATLQDHADAWDLPPDFRRPRTGLLAETARAAEASGVSLTQARAEPFAEDPADAVALVEQWCSADDARTAARVAARARDIRRSLGTAAPSYGLMHADLHQENYLFPRTAAAGARAATATATASGASDRTVAAIDFDDCGFGYRLDDLSVTLSEVVFRDDYDVLRAALLVGYRSVRELSSEHEELLDPLVAFRLLQIAVWLIDMRDHPSFRDHWHEDATDLIAEAGRLTEPKASAESS